MTIAYLIDPTERTVTPVKLDAPVDTSEELYEIYRLLQCDCIEAVRPVNADGDIIYIDEEGKINGKEDQQFFMCRLWPYDPLAGRGLWIGTNGPSNADPKMSLEYVQDHIVWSVRI